MNILIEKREPKNFYDIDQIKSIPILDVCSHFGVNVKIQGGRHWCSLRSEDKTPSTLIHVDGSGRGAANTFHDFGGGEHGDNIALACKLLGLDNANKDHRYAAIAHLAEAFHIAPKGRDARPSGELTNREYEEIGLYGDLATKNFSFDLSRQDFDKVREISEKYAMPMNQLKTEHPRTFERLLKTIAIPYVQEQRNSLYLDLWISRDAVQKAQAAGDLVFHRQDFSEDLERLKKLDNILSRAIFKTKLTVPQNREYDAKKLLAMMDSGELKPNFGSRSYKQMTRLAEAHDTKVLYRTLDLKAVYFNGETGFGNIPYSAFLSKGNAVVGYLERDKEALKPVFEQMALKDSTVKKKDSLNDKLQDAQQRQKAQASVTEPAAPSHDVTR